MGRITTLRAFMSLPGVCVPEHEVQMGETVEALKEANATPNGRNAPEYADRFAGLAKNTRIKRRWWARPFAKVNSTKTFEDRNDPAVEAMVAMGEAAIEGALKNAECPHDQVTAIITSNSVTRRTPGPAQHWITKLRLPESTWVLPMTELGCVGGAHSLALAAQWAVLQRATGHPDPKILVCVSECLHAVWRPEVRNLGRAIHNMLYGDLAVAFVVSLPPDTDDKVNASCPGLIVKNLWTHTFLDTTEKYTLTQDSEGLIFDSDPKAPKMAARAAALMQDELFPQCGPNWRPDTALLHPGSSKILDSMQEALGCTDKQVQASRDSYLFGGNQGGGTVIDAAHRYLTTSAENGQTALLAAIGPGMTATGITGSVYVP